MSGRKGVLLEGNSVRGGGVTEIRKERFEKFVKAGRLTGLNSELAITNSAVMPNSAVSKIRLYVTTV